MFREKEIFVSMQKGNSNWHTGARKMYLGDSKLTEYEFPSVQRESPWISAWSLSKTSSYNTDKVKPQQFHSLFLKLHLICNCFCHSSVSYSKGGRSVISSLLICVIRNAVWEFKFSPIGTNGAFAEDFGKMETWTPASLENWQQVERIITLLPLQRKLLAREWDYTKLMWFLTDTKKVGPTTSSAGNPIQRGHTEVDQFADLGELLPFCFLFQWVNFLWSHLLDQVQQEIYIPAQGGSMWAQGCREWAHSIKLGTLWNCLMRKGWSEALVLHCEGLGWEFP